MGWIKWTILQNLQWKFKEPLCSWNWRLMILSCTKCWGKEVLARYATKEFRLKPPEGDTKFLGPEGVDTCQESTPNVLWENRDCQALNGELSDWMEIVVSVFYGSLAPEPFALSPYTSRALEFDVFEHQKIREVAISHCLFCCWGLFHCFFPMPRVLPREWPRLTLNTHLKARLLVHTMKY